MTGNWACFERNCLGFLMPLIWRNTKLANWVLETKRFCIWANCYRWTKLLSFLGWNTTDSVSQKAPCTTCCQHIASILLGDKAQINVIPTWNVDKLPGNSLVENQERSLEYSVVIAKFYCFHAGNTSVIILCSWFFGLRKQQWYDCYSWWQDFLVNSRDIWMKKELQHKVQKVIQ